MTNRQSTPLLPNLPVPKTGRAYLPSEGGIEILDLTVPDIVYHAAEDAPTATALIAGLLDPEKRTRWTYSELREQMERTARALLARHKPGDRIAVWAPNVPEWVLLELGVAAAGMVLVTVNPSYRASELEFVLRQSRATALFLVNEYRGTDMAALWERVQPEVPGITDVVFLEDWEEFLTQADAATELPVVSPTDSLMIQYTSGTTGTPKGATLTHHATINNARLCAERLGLSSGDVWINPNPLFHGGGSVLGVLGTIAVVATNIPVYVFKPDLILELIETERPTVISGVTTMIIGLMEHPDAKWRDLSSLNTLMTGGSSVPPELVRRIEETLDLNFTICYGQTEASISIAQTNPHDTIDDKANTVGRPLPGVEVRIADTSGGEAQLGEEGEIQVRGYTVMAGYLDLPEATAAAVDADGWLHTGDIGSMDARGYLKVTGRLKEMIIRGGENVFPAEIEAVLHQHPSILEACVLGLPDAYWGEQIAAVIRCMSPHPEPDELKAFLRERLSPSKVPKIWHYVNDFPKTLSGKIQKFAVKELLGDAHAVALDNGGVSKQSLPAPGT